MTGQDRGVKQALDTVERRRVGPQVLEKPQLPTRAQHPVDLGQRCRLIGHRAQHQRRDPGVEYGVGGGQPVGDTVDDLDRHRRPRRLRINPGEDG